MFDLLFEYMKDAFKGILITIMILILVAVASIGVAIYLLCH